MVITDVETYALGIPLKPEFRMVSSLGQHVRSDYVLVRLLTDEGWEGIGEATATVRWSGETVWGVEAVIQHVLKPVVVGRDPEDIVGLNQALDGVAAHNWFAKSALEMACWDLCGRAAGKPVYELLGGACRPRAIRSRFSLGAYDVPRARRRAAELVEMGFQTIKVKVGGDRDQDCARVRAVRETIGEQRKLVIDANGGWDTATAIEAVNALDDCRLSLVEQPTPRGDFAALAAVRSTINPPVMADDSCFDLVEANELIRQGCCDVISVYPGKNGGISKSKAIVDLAAEHGIACTIGSNLEWDVATAAMGHLAVACPNLQIEEYEGDIYGPVYHERRIASPPLEISGPLVHLSDAPGLGMDLDWDAVRAACR